MESTLQTLFADAGNISNIVTYVTRFIFPLLAIVIFIRCLLPLMSGGRKPSPWAYLYIKGGEIHPLSHWENSIGRRPSCDVVLSYNFVSRVHAVIIRRGGGWYISDLDSKGGVTVNGKDVEGLVRVKKKDLITIAGLQMKMVPAEAPIQGVIQDRNLLVRIAYKAAEVAAHFSLAITLMFIILFQVLGVINISLAAGAEFKIIVPIIFLLFFALEIGYLIYTRFTGRRHIEPELLAFFLAGISMFICATTDSAELIKQFVAIVLGLGLLLVLTFFLNNLERARGARYIFAIGSVALLALNLILATAHFGALNWIEIGGVSIQPSEFVKVAFVFAGGATLDRLLSSGNFMKFLAYSGVCILALILMRDFGAALIFYVTFVVIIYMRSGDIKKLGLITGVTLAGVGLIASYLPYILSRFAAWRHVWEFTDTTGYQQVRTMIYTASGGMFGLGPGNGHLRYVAAADTDLVFGLIAEEWGLIVAIICALGPVALGLFAFMSVKSSRSSFYALVACGAATIFLMQTILNVFGSLDILPLTGVTLPFVSNGGSSMVACFGLLACIKSIDERHRAQDLDYDTEL